MQAGPISSDLPDRLLPDTIPELIADLRPDYDLILLDLPPAQSVAETRLIASVADATLLCVRWSTTPGPVVRHALCLLEQARARVVGCVLTRVDAPAHLRSGYADADVYRPRRRGRES
jgi:Mrp family chromosome partitioning ATPase